MKQVLNNVALGKKIDIVFQIVAFLAMIIVVTQTSYGLFGVYTLAIAQCISCIAWSLFFTGDTPRYKGGTTIRRIFLIVLALLALCAFDKGAFFGISLFMLVLGPGLGIAYFVITVNEMTFYSEARKPYYLL
jgi:hypothetical protein